MIELPLTNGKQVWVNSDYIIQIDDPGDGTSIVWEDWPAGVRSFTVALRPVWVMYLVNRSQL